MEIDTIAQPISAATERESSHAYENLPADRFPDHFVFRLHSRITGAGFEHTDSERRHL